MGDKAKKLTAELYHKNYPLFQELQRISLRGLFDRFCVEWNNATEEEKVALLYKLNAAGFPVKCLTDAVREMVAIDYGHGWMEANDSVREGMGILLDHALLRPRS